ncbi:aspartate/glutamate racemase family protein [Acerihabitans arboris]|uniref:Asp/Glu racemase n=1 Tax=Acerihabitans arboris TaxID=2691583 RepID=A0A845SN72_9GAMM|nr:aspartate/glutamate racemase family protein [Acerihabitans arboris]NDL64374.1 Asp/Glu racemase [Acerihabitans arboris]
MQIACLHTAASNIDVFERAAGKLGLSAGTLRHEVREDLLDAVECAGGITATIADETAAILLKLAQEADAVILTCSTLGPAVDSISAMSYVPILRVDIAIAERAIAIGGMIVVLCAAETTMAATSRLFSDAIQHSLVSSVHISLVPDAWALFKAGRQDAYLSTIARSVEHAYEEGATMVVLAQASMADAAELVNHWPTPITSPQSGLMAAINRISTEI